MDWWKDPKSLTRRLKKCYPEKMTNGTETFLTIKMECGFEAFGSYETWRSGFVATDDKGNNFSDESLEGLIHKMENKLSRDKKEKVNHE